MAKLLPGKILVLKDPEEDDIIFCEILSYKGSGYYYTNLSRDAFDIHYSKFVNPVSIHINDILDWQIPIEL